MIIRPLILSVVLIANAFAQNVALNPTGVGAVRDKAGVASVQNVGRATSGFDSAYRLSLTRPVQDKNFYLLSLFQRNRDVRKLLSRNKVLKQLARDKSLALKRAESCNNVGCFDELIRFDASAIEAVATELQTLAKRL